MILPQEMLSFLYWACVPWVLHLEISTRIDMCQYIWYKNLYWIPPSGFGAVNTEQALSTGLGTRDTMKIPFHCVMLSSLQVTSLCIGLFDLHITLRQNILYLFCRWVNWGSRDIKCLAQSYEAGQSLNPDFLPIPSRILISLQTQCFGSPRREKWNITSGSRQRS